MRAPLACLPIALRQEFDGKAGIAKRQAASRDLKQLVNIGVLDEKTVGKEKLFVHPKFLQLLTREGNEFSPYPGE